MNLTIHQLRIVVAVASAGSFTAAGQELTLAQSSLSRMVADVERRLGVPLFDRTTRRVELTAEGREFVGVASDVVRAFDRGMNHFQGLLDGSRGTIRIATLPSLAASVLPPVVSRFRRQHPDVVIKVEDGLLAQGLQQVADGTVDFALTRCDSPTDLAVKPLLHDEFVCVFPAGHRFVDSTEVTWEDLRTESLVGFDTTSSVRSYVDEAFAAAGVRPTSVTEARNIASVGGLVAAGMGVTAVPGLVLPLMAFAQLEARPLVAPSVTRQVGIVMDPKRPLAQTTQLFLAALDATPRGAWPLPAGASWR